MKIEIETESVDISTALPVPETGQESSWNEQILNQTPLFKIKPGTLLKLEMILNNLWLTKLLPKIQLYYLLDFNISSFANIQFSDKITIKSMFLLTYFVKEKKINMNIWITRI